MGRSKKIGDLELLNAIAGSPDPVVTAPELSDKLGYSNDGVRNRLKELENQNWVRSREVGSRAVVWWITTKGRDQLRNN